DPPGPVVERAAARLQRRTPPAAAPTSDAPASRPRHWREDKVGCLLSMASAVAAADPCPEIPAVFVTAERALLLAQGIGQCAVPQGDPPAPDETAAAAAPRAGRPEGLVGPAVARRPDVGGFGAPLG